MDGAMPQGAEADLGSHSFIRSLSVRWPFLFFSFPFAMCYFSPKFDPVSKTANPGPQYWDRHIRKNKMRSEKIL